MDATLESSQLLRSLKKIASTASRRETELRASCASLLQAIKKTKSKLLDSSAESCAAYFAPLFGGLASPTAKVQVLALDMVAKLVAAGFVAAADPAASDRALRLLRAVCKCTLADDAVALQALKAISALAVCPALSLANETLLEALRSCSRIASGTRNANNRATAKSCLQQMCLFVLERHAVARSNELSSTVALAATAARALSQRAAPPTRTAPTAAAFEEEGFGASSAPRAQQQWANALYPAVRVAIGMDRIAAVASSAPLPTPTVTSAAAVAAAAALPPPTPPRPPSAVDDDAPPPPPPPRRRSVASPGLAASSTTTPTPNPTLAASHAEDAVTVFRWLCITSITDFGGQLTPLCMQLLHAMLRSESVDRHFVATVGESLHDALVQNCVHADMAVVHEALATFKVLVGRFRGVPTLQVGIEILFSDIILPVLDSTNAEFERKRVVIETIRDVCVDADTVMSLFINHDASYVGEGFEEEGLEDGSGGDAFLLPEMQGLFEKIVHALERVTKRGVFAGGNINEKALRQQEELRIAALGGLVAILDSLVHFTNAQGAAEEEADGDTFTTPPPLLSSDESDLEVGANLSEEGSDGEDATSMQQDAAVAAGTASFESSSGSPIDAAAAAASTPRRRRLSSSSTSSSVHSRRPSTGEFGAFNSPATVSGNFDRKRGIQKELKRAFFRWNSVGDYKGAIAQLVAAGLLRHDPKIVAAFLLKYPDELSKKVTGEFLGGEKDFALSTLREYADMMDFSKLPLDSALRLFLSGFQLPGEAQKVDRMMERFAVRYCAANPGIFDNSDTAYVLAFSIIMLNTDLHNPQVVPEDKMTLEDFVKNCRGVDPNLDMEFLSGVFDRILHNPISLRELDRERERAEAKKGKGVLYRMLGMNNSKAEVKRRAESFVRERDDMVRSAKRRRENARASSLAAAEAALKAKPSESEYGEFQGSGDGGGGDDGGGGPSLRVQAASLHTEHSAREHVPPMFEVTWQSLLSVFSVLLQVSEDSEVVTLSLRGARSAIRIAGIHNMADPLMSFVRVLTKFSGLERLFAAKVPKNVQCIQALLSTALYEANLLGHAWQPIISALSQLARLHAFANGKLGLDPVPPPGASREERKSLALHVAMRETAELVTAAVNAEDLDRVFHQTGQLHDVAALHFVASICCVCKDELSALNAVIRSSSASAGIAHAAANDEMSDMSRGARVFCLQKVVEVAGVNMHRPAMLWATIWRHLSSCFTVGACHSDEQIAMFAVDSMKQLSFKFITSEMLHVEHTQRVLLQPFVTVMRRCENAVVRQLVLTIVQRVIADFCGEMNETTWKTLFGVLRLTITESTLRLRRKERKSRRRNRRRSRMMTFSVDTLPLAIRQAAAVSAAAAAGESVAKSVAIRPDEAVPSPELEKLGCTVAVQLCRTYFDAFAASIPAGFSRLAMLLQCLSRYCASPYAEVSADSIAELEAFVPRMLSTGLVVETIDSDGEPYDSADFMMPPNASVWFALISSMGRLSSAMKEDVRTLAVKTLFSLLTAHGASFPVWFWRRVLRDVLVDAITLQRNLLDVVEQERTGAVLAPADTPRAAVLRTMYSTLDATVALFDGSLGDVVQGLLPLALIELRKLACETGMITESELPTKTLRCFLALLPSDAALYDAALWSTVVVQLEQFASSSKHTDPVFPSLGLMQREFRFALIDAMGTVVDRMLSLPRSASSLDIDHHIGAVASTLETMLQDAIAVQHPEVEAAVSQQLTRILLTYMHTSDDEAERAFAVRRLASPCTVVLAHFGSLCAPGSGDEHGASVLAAHDGPLEIMLSALNGLPAPDLKQHMVWLYPLCVAILKAGAGEAEVRITELISALLMEAYNLFVRSQT